MKHFNISSFIYTKYRTKHSNIALHWFNQIIHFNIEHFIYFFILNLVLIVSTLVFNDSIRNNGLEYQTFLYLFILNLVLSFLILLFTDSIRDNASKRQDRILHWRFGPLARTPCGQFPWNRKNKWASTWFLTSPNTVFWVVAGLGPSIRHFDAWFRVHTGNTTFQHQLQCCKGSSRLFSPL